MGNMNVKLRDVLRLRELTAAALPGSIGAAG